MNKPTFFLIILIFNVHSFSQSYYSFLKFNPNSGTVSDENLPITHDDPNIVYWNYNIKQNGLPVYEFNLSSVPPELASYTAQISQQASNCADQWNTYGCLTINYNVLNGVVTEFSNDDDLFPGIVYFGITLYAVTATESGYQLDIYPNESLSHPYTTILLNKTTAFYDEGYEWTAEEENLGNEYIPFKSVFLHEMGHLIGLGHIYTDEPERPLLYFNTIFNQFLFSLTNVDISAQAELCDFNGSPVGIEDYLYIYLSNPYMIFETNHQYWGDEIRCNFIDYEPGPDYIVEWGPWEFKAITSCGEEILVNNNGNLYINTFPTGYNWLRDENGNVKGRLYKSGIDNDGIYHETYLGISISGVPNTLITSGILNSNTTWCGEITITGNITVPSAFTLKVNPGAVIKFAPNASLLLYGKLDAMGCTFTSQSGTASDRWGNINFYGSSASNSSIKYAQIKYGTKIQINNANNVKIQSCNFTEIAQGIHYYNSSGEFSGNTLTSSSIYNGFFAEGSSVYCYDNKLTKQSPNEKRGWGIYYGGGASGFIYKNDLYGWDVGVGAIWGSSPHFRPDPAFIQNQNNRIRNSNHGVLARNDSWPVVGGPSTGYGINSIYSNTRNINFTSGGTLWAYATYFGGTPTSSMFYTTSGSTIDYRYWLSDDPWTVGLLKTGSETEVIAAGGSLSPESTNDPESFFYGIDLRNQNKYKEAKDFFISYLEKNPNDQAAYVELYNCYNSETASDLVRYFSNLPKEASRNHKLLLANLYLKEGKINEAKNVNNEIASENPNSILSVRSKLNRINIALYNEDNIYEAISLFEEVASRKNLSDAEELSFVKEKILNHAKVRGIESIPELQNSAALKRDFIAEAASFDLLGNYPNPFNPTTTISYNLPYESAVELKIYDIMGREVKSFTIPSQSSGYQSIFWDGTNENGIQVSSGIYIYRIVLKSLENNEMFVKTAKLMMLK